jgi:hypothetical protein
MSKYRDKAAGFAEGKAAKDRPEFVTDEHLTFLDELRESAVCNMFGARIYINEEFPELTTKEAAAVLSYWMKTFGTDNR